MRYAVLPRRGTEPGVGLFMRVEGGFIAERRPGERGLAHLIEHLAFESPTNHAPDDLRRVFRIEPDSPPGKVGITIENADGYRMIRLLDHVAPGQ